MNNQKENVMNKKWDTPNAKFIDENEVNEYIKAYAISCWITYGK